MKNRHLFIAVLLFTNLIISTAQQWTEIDKIVATPERDAEYNYFGCAVSVDSNYAVIGSYGYNSYKGCAYVLCKNEEKWDTVATLTASDGSSQDYFGFAVSISDDVVIVGAKYDEDIGDRSGTAYIFEKPATGWENMTETIKIVPSDNTEDDLFGQSVCISEDYAVIGAYGDDDKGSFSGSAYVYEKTSGSWSEVAKLTASDGDNEDSFGNNLCISGDYIVIGAYNKNEKDYNSGAAYIFHKPTDGWIDTTEVAKLTPSDGAYHDYFGYSVSIYKNNVVIGAYSDDDNGDASGSAYVFEQPATGWVDMTETAKLKASDGAANDLFGISVAIDDGVILVGSRGNIDLSNGSAYIFEKPLSGWTDTTETAKLNVCDSVVGQGFGWAVDVSYNNVLIGSPFDTEYGTKSGSAYLFEKSDSGWVSTTEYQKVLPSAPELNNKSDNFGSSVAIDGNYAVVGCPGTQSSKGSAYVLYYNGTSWDIAAKLRTSNGTKNKDFGYDVSILGNYVVVTSTQYAYVFEKPSSGWVDMTETAILSTSDSIKIGSSVGISENLIAVGASGSTVDSITYAGSVYLFEKPANGWTDTTEVAKLTASDVIADAYFGHSIDVSDSVVMVGAIGATGVNRYGTEISNRGAVYIFEKPSTGWCDTTETKKVTDPYGSDGDYFGSSVSFNNDYMVIGAKNTTNEDDSYLKYSGSAYVYKKTSSDWTSLERKAKLTASGSSNSYSYFGCSVDISDDYIVIGASSGRHNNSSPGLAYVFEKPSSGWEKMTETFKIVATDTVNVDEFGCSVGISGDKIISGASRDNGNGENAGAVYLYNREKVSGISEQEDVNRISLDEQFIVYPNPATDYVTIYTDEITGNTTYSIVSITGKEIRNGNISDINTQIDISGYDKGIYFLQIKSENEKTVFKLLKE